MDEFHTDTTGAYASYLISTNDAVVNVPTYHNPQRNYFTLHFQGNYSFQ